MTDIEKLKALKSLKAQRDELDKQIKALENGRWKPEIGEKFYHAGSFYEREEGYVWGGDFVDEYFYDVGFVFRTAEELRAYVNRLKAVTKYNDYIRSTCFVADWNNHRQAKHFPTYCRIDKWCHEPRFYGGVVTDIMPAASANDVLDAIASLGDDERWLR